MGFEIITQPQVFLSPITAVNGVYGANDIWPLLTTYQSWTSTASINASAFPIPGTWTMLDEPASFLVTVGGVLQPPSEYTIDRNFRILTFGTPVSAGVEIGVLQLGTAALSTQTFSSLTATNAIVNNLLVTNLTAVSSILQITDIQLYETSGFDVNGSINVTDNIFTNTLTAENTTLTNLTATNLVGTDTTLTNLTATNLVGTDTALTNLTATSIILPNSGTLFGSTSSTFISIGTLSAREIDLIHTPANDGVDPILDIGETTTEGFSGFRVRYEESSNRLLVQTITPSLTSNSAIIDRATGQVGISATPNQALTVAGNISATGIVQASQLQLRDNTLTTNTAMGTAVLGTAAGVVINTNRVTLNSRIFLSTLVPSAFATIGALFVGARVPTTSFTVSSTNINDRSIFSWMIVEPTL